jgi:hypothetical protein
MIESVFVILGTSGDSPSFLPVFKSFPLLGEVLDDRIPTHVGMGWLTRDHLIVANHFASFE